MISLLISGAQGRMGRAVTQLARSDSRFELLGGLEREPHDASSGSLPMILSPEKAGTLVQQTDVIIDFSAPDFLQEILEQHRAELAGTALVVGTTGLDSKQKMLLDEVSESCPVLVAANFSIGVNLLLALAERAAGVLGPGYDIEIQEMHHRHKEDAPSGTALALGEAVARGRGLDLARVRSDGRSGRPGARPENEIGFHALRGGDVIGDHTVFFIGERERVELTHRASDRSLFADGALRAAAWLSGKSPGRYTMADVLEL